jgi:cholesterol transport system auxiliary component
MSPDRRRALFLLPALLGLANCTARDLLLNAPAPTLYELTPKSTFPPDLPDTESVVRVESVTATAGLNTTRIALRPSATELDYYANALWIDVVPVMVQNLTVESLENAGKIDALGPNAPGVPADLAMLVHVREFQAEYTDLSLPPTVRVRLQIRLIRLPRRQSVAATGTEGLTDAVDTSIEAVVDAFDEALGKALRQLVEWTARTLGELEA